MLIRVLIFLSLTASAFAQSTGSVSIVSGNGQVVMEQFRTVVPMVIQAKDVNGRPVANVTVTWTVKDGMGTISMPSAVTDANGLASAYFIATSLQLGYSFVQTTVNASTSIGNVDFWITTSVGRNPNGGLSAPPLVELVSPVLGSRVVSGPGGATIPGAIVVRVTAQSGTQSGQPIPHVGVRIDNAGDPSATPSATCNAPAGIVLTNDQGIATCDAVLNTVTGTATITAIAGEFQNTPPMTLQIAPGSTCTFAINPSAQTAAASASTGTVNVITSSACGWTAASNAPWLTISGTAGGTGNGTVTYAVAANTGAARTGTLTIAGQTFTLTQNAPQASLAITTPANLPSATVGTNYTQTFTAAGGRSPYTFNVTGSLPPGLAFNSGTLSGVPSTSGTYTFTLTATDASSTAVAQTLTLVVVTAGSGPVITTASLPNGTANTPYQQVLSVSGGCVSPFSPQPTLAVSSGTLPPGLILNGYTLSGLPTTNGAYSFTLKVSDSCGRTSTANLSIVIGSVSQVAQLTANPSSISFTAQGGTVPVTIQSTGAALNFQASANGTSWLALDKTSGTTPGTLNVALGNIGTLTPGSYNASISVSAQGSSISIPVTLTIAAAPTLAINPGSISITQTFSAAAKSVQQPLSILTNGAPVAFTASAISTGNWLQVSAASGQTPSTLNAIINYGALAAGNYSGSISITPAGGAAKTIPVSLTITAPPTISATPDALSFAYQQGSASPAQQNLHVSATGTAAAYSVSAASPGNWLSALRGGGSDQVSVSVTPGDLAPGTYRGTISLISADPAVAPLTVPVTLTVAAPTPALSAIANAASFTKGAVSPGEIVTLFGSTLGPSNLVASKITTAGTLDSSLAGTRVYFDGIPAPLLYTVSGQVSAIVPYSVAGRTTTIVQTEWNGVRSAPQEVPVSASAPGIFVLDNQGQGAIVNQDATINFPATPAPAGSIVSIYATGEGEVSPAVPDGQIIGDILPTPKLPVSVTIGGQPAEVIYAGGSPGLASGLLQLNVRIPDGLTGRQQVILKVGDATSQPGVFVSIQ